MRLVRLLAGMIMWLSATTPIQAQYVQTCGSQSAIRSVVDNYVYTGITSVSSTQKALLVSIQGSHDAHIGLGNKASDFDSPLNGKWFYEFFIGGYNNGMTALRKQSARDILAAGNDGSGYLSPTEFRDYWIMWLPNGNGASIQVGYGNVVGQNVILSFWDGIPYNVQFLALAAWGSQGQTIKYKTTLCSVANAPWVPARTWSPPAALATPLANVWHRYETKYANGGGPYIFRNYIWDQLMANNDGTIRYCVRWESPKTVDTTTRDKIQVALNTRFNTWISWLQDAWDWNGYGFPWKTIQVKVVGWAVKDRKQLLWDDNSVDIYTTLDSEGAPQCAPACGRFFHQDGNYASCPGGAARHYDMSLWLTTPFGGGVGGDWGQRVDADGFVTGLNSPSDFVLQHEIGHGFGLDDFYDWDPLPASHGGFLMGPSWGALKGPFPTPFDIWMLRDWWTHFQSVNRYTSSGTIRTNEVTLADDIPPLEYQDPTIVGAVGQTNQEAAHIRTHIIIGTVVGGVTALMVIIGMMVYCRRQRHQFHTSVKQMNEHTVQMTETPQVPV